MKKTVYALCGATMITTAVVLRVLSGGGGELLVLIALGVLLLLASADTPTRTRGV